MDVGSSINTSMIPLKCKESIQWKFTPLEANVENGKREFFEMVAHLPLTKRNMTKLLLGSVEICEEEIACSFQFKIRFQMPHISGDT